MRRIVYQRTPLRNNRVGFIVSLSDCTMVELVMYLKPYEILSLSFLLRMPRVNHLPSSAKASFEINGTGDLCYATRHALVRVLLFFGKVERV